MKRLLHKLFRAHTFVPFELVEETLPEEQRFGSPARLRETGPRVWYVGYQCSCGEPGFLEGPLWQ